MHVATRSHSFACLQATPLDFTRLSGGFWGRRQATNRHVTLRHGYRMLEQAGNFNNLRLVVGQGEGQYRGYVFQDSDVYKWLEAVSLELARGVDAELSTLADRAIDLIASVQMPDGYINSYYQLHKPDQRWTNLDHDHEMYCGGHLIEAGIAHRRATGRTGLLNIARRFADHLDAIFGPGRRPGACGHPEIELALVELYRETGERRYLDLAGFFIDQRGHKTMRGYGSFGPEYHQDRTPVREASVVEGHAVRQMYLNAGVTDVYLETGEAALIGAMRRLWRDMTTRKMYLTGGIGSRSFGEAFGDSYELPSTEAYCETCASIASIMWNWRMLLATAEPDYADLIERTLYNGFLSGISLDGLSFFYENPLQSEGGRQRGEWHRCACCPPNVMRLISMLDHLVATADAAGIQIHHYAPARVNTNGAERYPAVVRIDTEYPWEGNVRFTIEETRGAAWQLALRVPAWCEGASVRINDQIIQHAAEAGTYVRIGRAWRHGDVVRLEMPMPPRLTMPHPRIDAVRGCVAIERGPLAYCLEQPDQEPELDLSDAWIDPAGELQTSWRGDVLGGVATISAPGFAADVSVWGEALYRADPGPRPPGRATTLTAIPYYAWALRGPGKMRVWIPSAG